MYIRSLIAIRNFAVSAHVFQQPTKSMNQERVDQRKKEEWRTFLFFAVVMAPVLSVVVVSGYGLVVWLYQMFAGPPTG